MTVRGKILMQHVTQLDGLNELRLHRKIAYAKYPRPILLVEGAYDKWFWQPLVSEQALVISVNNRNHVLDVLQWMDEQTARATLAVIDADVPMIQFAIDEEYATLFLYDAHNLETWLLMSPAASALLERVREDVGIGELVYRSPAMEQVLRLTISEAITLLWEWSYTLGLYRAVSAMNKWNFRLRRINLIAIIQSDGRTIDTERLTRVFIENSGQRKLTEKMVNDAVDQLRQKRLTNHVIVNGHDWMNALVNVFLRQAWDETLVKPPIDGWSTLDFRDRSFDQTWAETILRTSVDLDWLNRTTLVKNIRTWEYANGCQLLKNH